MPAVPKWVGDAMESVLTSKYLPVRVRSTESLNPFIRKISFNGNFDNIEFWPGYAVAFRVDDKNFRNYTPSLFDQESGICEIIFHVRETGPGSNFVRNLQTGDRLKMIVPRGRQLFRPDKKFHFLFGDETSLSLSVLFARKIKALNLDYTGMLEMAEENIMVPRQLELVVKTVLKSPEHEKTFHILPEIKSCYPEYFSAGVFYLTGNAASIQAVRKELRQLGVRSKDIIAQAYWAKGKKGL